MNIIKDNRVVADKTFATRFVSFLKDIQVNDPMSDEELEYLRRVANSLLLHQANTCTEKEELNYLDRCHPNGYNGLRVYFSCAKAQNQVSD